MAGIGDWHNYTNSNDGYAIASNSNKIYCATNGGLLYYNIDTGHTKKYLNSDGLGDVGLKSLKFDNEGNLFAGGSNGTLTKITPDGSISVYNFEYTNDIKYFLLSLDVDGDTLWVATEIGVARFLINHNGGEFQDIAWHLGQIPQETIVRAVKVIGDYVWAGTDSGMAFIHTDSLLQDPQKWHSYTRGQAGLTNPRIFSIASNNDTIFIGTADGVFYFAEDSTWHNIGLNSQTIYDLESSNGILNAATDLGIYSYSLSGWNRLSIDSLMTTRTRGIAYDSLGNIWAAFNNGGFASFKGSFWQMFTVPGPATNNIIDIAVDSSQTIWLTHDGDGLSRFDGANWSIYNSSNSGLRSSGVHAVEYDYGHNLLWLGSWGEGLYSYDGQQWRNFNQTNSPFQGVLGSPSYVAIPDVKLDTRDDIWGINLAGAYPGGNGSNTVAAAFNPTDSLWQAYYENASQVPDNNTMTKIIFNDNDVFIAANGIYWLNYGDNPFDISDDTWNGQIVTTVGIQAMVFDRWNHLYYGSPYGLAYYSFSYNTSFIIDLPDGYRSMVSDLNIDGLGNIWVGTDSGVVVFAPSELPNPTQMNWINKFKINNSSLLNSSIRHIEIDRKTGFVYIGTAAGLSIYESGYVQPSPSLNDIEAYPNPVNIRKGQKLAYFLRVPADAEVSIYTVAGDLVKRFIYDGANNYWDLKNNDKQDVSAGIYFFYVKAGKESGMGKIAVIR